MPVDLWSNPVVHPKTGTVFRKHLISGIRNLSRQKVTTSITIAGLAVGIASIALIMLYLQHELSYDRHWKDADRMVRISTHIDYGSRSTHTAISPYQLGPSLQAFFPALEEMTRVTRPGNNRVTLRFGPRKTGTRELFLADSTFFNFFQHAFLEGNPARALNQPRQVVLTKKLAIRLFGNNPALGEEVTIGPDYPMADQTFTVTGVVEDPKNETHLRPEAIVSSLTFPKDFINGVKQDWLWVAFYTYLKCKDEKSLTIFRDNLHQWKKKTIDPWLEKKGHGVDLHFMVQPVTAIHHQTDLEYDMSGNRDIIYTRLFAYIALLILIIVGINYINLSTARSINRASEVGLRKTMGAGTPQLVRQFLGESLLIGVLAFVLGSILAEILLPFYNNLLNTNLQLTGGLFDEGKPSILLLLLGIALLMSMISGFFPAIILSRFKPVQIVGRDFWNQIGSKISKRSLKLRRTLVLFQFILTAIMITGTLIILQQLQFMRNKDLGYNQERVLVIELPDDYQLRKEINNLKDRLIRHPGIVTATCGFNFPGYETDKTMVQIKIENGYHQEMINYYLVDQDFMRTLELEMHEGSFFSHDTDKEKKSSYVINEAALKIFGTSPIGKKVKCELAEEGEIIGVTKNFHYASLHQPIEPLLYIYQPNILRYLGVRIDGNNQKETFHFIRRKCEEFSPKHVHIYTYLDEKVSAWYHHEERILMVMGYFSTLTLLLACLGLFGLSCYMAIRKKREIAIRKSMGCSYGRILRMFTGVYLKWIIIANIIAFPISWFIINRWLQTFAFHTDMKPYIFLSTAVITILVSLITTGYHASRSANTDPAKVLKDE